MTDSALMDADCIHGVVWFECPECVAEQWFEKVGGVEWCAIHQGIWDECAEHYTPEGDAVCDMWVDGESACIAVPLYLKSDASFGEAEANDPVFDPGPLTP